ncbi:MAG TPA: tetratricopeptide repeat protein [Usitatibacteraceae bacterium]
MLTRLKALLSRSQNPDVRLVPKADKNYDAMATAPDESFALLAKADSCFVAGELDQAAACYHQVLLINKDDVAANVGLGGVLKALGRHTEAERCLQYAISLAAEVGKTHHLLGSVFQEQGKLDDAIRYYKKSLELDPSLAVAYRDLCFAYFQRGQIAYSKQTISKGIALYPNFADLHYYRGNLYSEEGDAASALACYEHALSISPDVAAWHFNRGVALQDLKRHEEALASYGQAIRLQPDYADAYNNSGSALFNLKRYEDALISFVRAIQLRPDFVSALNNHGYTLKALGRPEAALLSYGKALQLQPDNTDALNNRGIALQELHRHEEALMSYGRASEIKPNFDQAYFNESLCRLQLGDFISGWQKYEWRERDPYLIEFKLKNKQPLWLGKEPLLGKTILLQSEQGLGDTIQFCRYAKYVAAMGATVLLEVQAPLKSILGDLGGVTQLLARGETVPKFDYHCPLLSLPLALHTRLDTIPADVPYLRSDPERVRQWAARLGHKTRPRVGLVWSGRIDHENDRNRSIPLGKFSAITSDRAQFVSLQKEFRAADKAVLEKHGGIEEFSTSLLDFADTAALVDLMDIVVTVDTSVAHLAGALGKPTWLLLPFNPDFRWLLGRDDSPWYPSAKLFRQPRLGDWDSVLDAVGKALRVAFMGQAEYNLTNTAPQAEPAKLTQDEDAYTSPLKRGDEYLKSGEYEAAVANYRAALAINANDATAYIGLGRVAIEQGDHEDAVRFINNALSANPPNANAHYLLGTVFHAQLKLDEAIKQFEKALSLQPDFAPVYGALCYAYFQSGQRDKAKEILAQGIALHPEFADLYFFRGNLYVEDGDHANAVPCYQRAVSIASDIATWHFNLGFALQSINQHKEALLSYDRVIELQPDYPNVHNNRASAFLFLNRHEDALSSLNEALKFAPDSADALNNRGFALINLKRPEEALASIDLALVHRPDYAEAHNNRGLVLHETGRYEDALISFERAIQLKPDYGQARFNESLGLLLTGNFAAGWQKYESRDHEWRERDPYLIEFRVKSKQPLWLGKESLLGKTILLQSEQGLGDTVQFCRYAKRVAAMGATVLLEVQPALKSILGDLEGVTQLLARGEPIPRFDYHCPLLSLPLALRTRLDTIPAGAPYLHSDPERIRQWAVKLGHKTRPRVGLVWSGNQDHKNDRNRSIPLASFNRIVSDRAQFVCLQVEVRQSDKVALDARGDILFVGNAIKDFADTAALIELMDIVVTVDTSVAHLAGALGKPTWLLIPFTPDFRWMLYRSDSPWYPTVKLFRQPQFADWDSVLETVANELKVLA